MEAVLVTMLAPFLPILLRAGNEMADQLADQVGQRAADFILDVWDRLGPSVLKRPKAKEATEQVESTPDDDDARAELELQLGNLLKADAELRQDLEALQERGDRDHIITGDGSIVAKGGSIVARDGSIVARDGTAIGHIGRQVIHYGRGDAAGGDIIKYKWVFPRRTGWERIANARGPAKWLMAAGIVTMLGGIAVFGLTFLEVFSNFGFGSRCQGISDPVRLERCLSREGGFTLPETLPLGFGIMLVGFIIFGAGVLLAYFGPRRRRSR
jgi:hypothetical protein